MKVFILGLPNSGRSTIAKALAKHPFTYHISTDNWIKSSFRSQQVEENIFEYEEAYREHYVEQLKLNPFSTIHKIHDLINNNSDIANNFIIDGSLNPKEFSHLFDYNKDIVIFLNRLDNLISPKEHESIEVNVIRDYCLWLGTTGLLNKERWLEFNFRIPGDNSDFIKVVGNKNTVVLTKNFNKTIHYIKEMVWK